MKLSKNITSVYKMIVFASLMTACLGSCNFIIENYEKRTQENLLKQDLIETNKNDAKLLVMASQTNVDIIKLCQVMKDGNLKNDIKDLATDLEKTHLKIFENYNNIARKKLISIPVYSSIELNELNDYIKDDKFIESNLDLITKKIKVQIQLLKKLSITTNNSELRDMSFKTNTVLKSKLDKTKVTLEKLKINKISSKKH